MIKLIKKSNLLINLSQTRSYAESIADIQIKPVDFLLNIWYCCQLTPSLKAWLSLLLKLETVILAVTAFYNPELFACLCGARRQAPLR